MANAYNSLWQVRNDSRCSLEEAATQLAPAQDPHTAVANQRSPGTWSGRTALALATMPVPITEANQFGPRSRKMSPGRSRFLNRPNGVRFPAIPTVPAPAMSSVCAMPQASPPAACGSRPESAIRS